MTSWKSETCCWTLLLVCEIFILYSESPVASCYLHALSFDQKRGSQRKGYVITGRLLIKKNNNHTKAISLWTEKTQIYSSNLGSRPIWLKRFPKYCVLFFSSSLLSLLPSSSSSSSSSSPSSSLFVWFSTDWCHHPHKRISI